MARLVFAGSPDAAVPALEALVSAGHEVVLVVSRPDARRGRGRERSPSPVKASALGLGLEVTDDLEQVCEVGAEMGVVVAYGRIVPSRILDVLPMCNLHFSLLPRWRGAAPVERALLAGDQETGVCVMRLEAGLDTGPVLASRTVPIGDAHLGELRHRLAKVGAELLVEVLGRGVDDLGPGRPQVGEPTYARKIDPEELRLDWSRPAAELSRVVRLDRAFTTHDSRRLRVLEARAVPEVPDDFAVGEPGTLRATSVVTREGWLELQTVQPEGKRPMDASDWLRGAQVVPGTRLGGDEGAR